MVNGIDIVNTAKKFLGVKYIFGGSSPSGFDCSGLVYYVYKSNGINISRTTKTQINEGTEISRDNLQPGDLVFPTPDHVAIYIGNNQIIHAPETGKNVEICNLYKFWRARRILSNISFISFFDSNLYNSLYDDLKKAFNGDKNKLYNHYISFGIKEGRICSYIYDPFYYQNCNEDLKRSFNGDMESLFNHYINYGIKEGRKSSPFFDPKFYLNKYHDLKNAFGNDYEKAREHFLNYGMNEGRIASEDFNVINYRKRYNDLNQAYGDNWKSYFDHYLKFGRNEGRNPK